MEETGIKARRSWLAWVLIGSFLLLSLLGWLRFQQTLVFWNTLIQQGAWPGPLYIALGGVLWGVIGLPAAWGIWRGTRWAPIAARAAALIYLATYWADRLWFSPGAGPFTSWPFSLAVSIVWLGLVFAVTSRPGSRYPEEGSKS